MMSLGKAARTGLTLSIAFTGAAGLGGCLQRTITITSEPPGALVWLNDMEVGRTPLETDFTFFGTYDVRLHLDGYEPIATGREAPAPFYEYPGPDLVAEALPITIPTRIHWHFWLAPVAERAPDTAAAERAVLERARQLRGQLAPQPPARSGPAGTPTTAAPSGTSPSTTEPAPTRQP